MNSEIGYIVVDKDFCINGKNIYEVMFGKNGEITNVTPNYFYSSIDSVFESLEPSFYILKVKLRSDDNMFSEIYNFPNGEFIKKINEEGKGNIDILERLVWNEDFYLKRFNNKKKMSEELFEENTIKYFCQKGYSLFDIIKHICAKNDENLYKILLRSNLIKTEDLQNILNYLEFYKNQFLKPGAYSNIISDIYAVTSKQEIFTKLGEEKDFFGPTIFMKSDGYENTLKSLLLNILKNPNITDEMIKSIFKIFNLKSVNLEAVKMLKDDQKFIIEIFKNYKKHDSKILDYIIKNNLVEQKEINAAIKKYNKLMSYVSPSYSTDVFIKIIKSPLISSESLEKIIKNYDRYYDRNSIDFFVEASKSEKLTLESLIVIIRKMSNIIPRDDKFLASYNEIMENVFKYGNDELKNMYIVILLGEHFNAENRKSNFEKNMMFSFLLNLKNKTPFMISKLLEILENNKLVLVQNVLDEISKSGPYNQEPPIQLVTNKTPLKIIDEVINSTYRIRYLNCAANNENLTVELKNKINEKLYAILSGSKSEDYFKCFPSEDLKNLVSSDFISVENLKTLKGIYEEKYTRKGSVDDFKLLILLDKQIIKRQIENRSENSELPELSFKDEYYNCLKRYFSNPRFDINSEIKKEIEKEGLSEIYCEEFYKDIDNQNIVTRTRSVTY